MEEVTHWAFFSSYKKKTLFKKDSYVHYVNARHSTHCILFTLQFIFHYRLKSAFNQKNTFIKNMALKIYGPADDLPHFLAIICNDNFLECMWHPIMHDFFFDIHTQVFFLWTNLSIYPKYNPFNSLAISLFICAALFTIQFLSFTDFYSTVIIFEIKKNTDCSTRTQHSSRLSE